MSLVTQVSDLATRIGTEFKTVRTEIDAIDSGATNLAATLSASNTIITSDTGTDATIPATDGTNAGVMTPTMLTKLNGIEAAADVTDAGNVASTIHGATAKTTPVSADELALIDSAASNVLKRITYSNLSSAIVALITDSAPGTLDTLNELAAALGDDPDFAATTATALGLRLRFDASQTLDGAQKTQGQANLGVYSTTQIGDPTTNFVTVFEAALV